MREIVARIGDDGQRIGWQDAVEAERELGTADAARQCQHRTVRVPVAHRKRTCSGGRTIAAAGASGAVQERPRTTTIGAAPAAWPRTMGAAAAISAAKPVPVTSGLLPDQT